jgi:flagellar motor switch protein FliN/FliY
VTLAEELNATADVATEALTALTAALGDAEPLTVGEPAASVEEALGDQPLRVIAMKFTAEDGPGGVVAIVASAAFGESLERSASDELLLTACKPALEAAINTIARVAGSEIERDSAAEIELPLLAEAAADDDLIVRPFVREDAVVACLAIAVSPVIAQPDSQGAGGPMTGVVSFDAPAVLADVEMGVTAELGRCRMSVRELLSITPGAVIDLDRPAGAPVDVLVNGKLIARGEVVVIDEEFGIRISEILKPESVLH